MLLRFNKGPRKPPTIASEGRTATPNQEEVRFLEQSLQKLVKATSFGSIFLALIKRTRRKSEPWLLCQKCINELKRPLWSVIPRDSSPVEHLLLGSCRVGRTTGQIFNSGRPTGLMIIGTISFTEEFWKDCDSCKRVCYQMIFSRSPAQRQPYHGYMILLYFIFSSIR